jgi:hypothetical protein
VLVAAIATPPAPPPSRKAPLSTAVQTPVARVRSSGLAANAGISAASAGRGAVAVMLITTASSTIGISVAFVSASAAAAAGLAAYTRQLSAITRPRSGAVDSLTHERRCDERRQEPRGQHDPDPARAGPMERVHGDRDHERPATGGHQQPHGKHRGQRPR